MRECAFCNHTGKLTREHISSKWMNKLFPGRLAVRRFDHKDGSETNLSWNSLEFKARVVCKTCNEGWMHDIET